MALRYFLACLALPSCLVSAQPLAYGLLGQTVHLRPNIRGHPDGILWKRQGGAVVKFNGNEEHVYSPYQNRVTLDWVSAELDIADLRPEDSGEYELETYTNKELHHFQYKLEVIGKVSKPSVSCYMNSSSSDTRGVQATLTCSAEPTQPRSLMKYQWESSANVQPGPELTIFLEDERDDKTYTCRVSNPLTSETTTFTARTCYPDKSSSVALAVSQVLIFVALLIVIVGAVFCKLKNKACFAGSDRDDVENRRRPGETEERDQEDESKPLFDRAPTLPSHQRLRPLAQGDLDTAPDLPANNHTEYAAADLGQGGVESVSDSEEKEVETEEASSDGLSPSTPLSVTRNSPGSKQSIDKETAPPPVSLPLGRKPSFSEEQLDPSCNHEAEASGDQVTGPSEPAAACDRSDSDEGIEASPVGGLDLGEGSQSDVESSAASAPPESEEEEDDIEEEKPPAANGLHPPPPPTPPLPLTQNSPDKGTEDTDGENQDSADSDQGQGETECEPPVLEKTTEALSTESSEEEEPSTAPKQNTSESASHERVSNSSQEETHKTEHGCTEMEKAVSGDESEEEEEEEEEENLYLEASQSPPPQHADVHVLTNTSESAALQDPDEAEGLSGHESEDSAAEEDNCERQTDDKTKDESGPEEEQPDNKNQSEDKEGPQKTEAVEKSK